MALTGPIGPGLRNFHRIIKRRRRQIIREITDGFGWDVSDGRRCFRAVRSVKEAFRQKLEYGLSLPAIWQCTLADQGKIGAGRPRRRRGVGGAVPTKRLAICISDRKAVVGTTGGFD